MSCRGSDCSESAVIGTLRTPGQLMTHSGAAATGVAASCAPVCAQDAGTKHEAAMASGTKVSVIAFRTESPLRVSDRNPNSAVYRIVRMSIVRVHRTRGQFLV